MMDQHAIYVAPGFSLSMALAATTLGDSTMDPLAIEKLQYEKLCSALGSFETSCPMLGNVATLEMTTRLISQMMLSHNLFCSPDLVFRYFIQRDDGCSGVSVWAPLFALIGTIFWIESGVVDEARVYLAEEISFWKRLSFISWDVLVALFRQCSIIIDEEPSNESGPLLPCNAIHALLALLEKPHGQFYLLAQWIALLLHHIKEIGIPPHIFRIDAFSHNCSIGNLASLSDETVPVEMTDVDFWKSQLSFQRMDYEGPLLALMKTLQNGHKNNSLTMEEMNAIIQTKLVTLIHLNMDLSELRSAKWSPFYCVNGSLHSSSFSWPIPWPHDLPTRSLFRLKICKLEHTLSVFEQEALMLYCIQESKRVRLMARFLEIYSRESHLGDKVWIWMVVVLDFFHVLLKLKIVKHEDPPSRNKYVQNVLLSLARLGHIPSCDHLTRISILNEIHFVFPHEHEGGYHCHDGRDANLWLKHPTISSIIECLEHSVQTLLPNKHLI